MNSTRQCELRIKSDLSCAAELVIAGAPAGLYYYYSFRRSLTLTQ